MAENPQEQREEVAAGGGSSTCGKHVGTIATHRLGASWYCRCGVYAHLVRGTAVEATASHAAHVRDVARSAEEGDSPTSSPKTGADHDCARYGHNAKPGEWCPHCGKTAPSSHDEVTR